MVSAEQVRWAYRILLEREPESEQAVEVHRNNGTVTELREAFLSSPEYRREKWIPPEVEARLPRQTGAGEPGIFRDRLGVRTRCAYLPEHYQQFSGGVAEPPFLPLHDVAEWQALFRSASEAGDSLTVVELGAGWGPWLVAGAALARHFGLRPHLAGVEASAEHMEFMRTHFRDNGLDPNEHLLIQAIVGKDGTGIFPKLEDAAAEWGTAAGEGDEMPSVSLESVLQRLPVVDLVHCDIQGSEAEVLTEGYRVLDERVKRIVVGTHSRRIEADLLALFREWCCEAEKPCELNAGLQLVRDGVQVWRNPAFTGSYQPRPRQQNDTD